MVGNSSNEHDPSPTQDQQHTANDEAGNGWTKHFLEELKALQNKLISKVNSPDSNIQNLTVKCEELKSSIEQLGRLASDETSRQIIKNAFGAKDTVFSAKELKSLELYIKTMNTPVRKMAKKIVPILQPLVIVMTPAFSVYLAVLEIDEDQVGTDSESVYILSTIFGIILLSYLWALCKSTDHKNIVSLRLGKSGDTSKDSDECCRPCCQQCQCFCRNYDSLTRPGNFTIS